MRMLRPSVDLELGELLSREAVPGQHPLDGEAEDLLGMALYLLAPASNFCTGQVMYVDGGFTAG